MKFSLTDLFVAGIGFDISGAILLARGLLVSPAMIARLAGTMWGMNIGDAIDRCRNRVDATFGIVFLALGFVMQAAGYTLQLAGIHTGKGGAGRIITAGVVGLLGVAVAFGAWRILRTSLLKRLLVAVARAAPETKDESDPSGWTRKRVKRLADMGEAAGWPRAAADDDGTTRVNYIKRVFGEDVPAYPVENP